MIEISYKNLNNNNVDIEHKATIQDDSIDSVIYGVISILECEWGEASTEEAIKRYFNL
jgi:hypothetical protein